jgi:hypothetical protein
MSKKFKDTTIGQILFGAASAINPTLGNVLQGVTSPKEAIEAITKSDAPAEDKVKLQQLIYDQQTKEIEAITSRWQADSMSDSWLSKNVRPLVLVWCIVIFSFAGILDSVETIPFNIHETWNDTFEKVMMAVILAYFGGRTTEKASNIFNDNINLPEPGIKTSGASTTGTTGVTLKDSSNDFLNSATNPNGYNVNGGDIVYNTSTNAVAKVLQVVDANTITLDTAIMAAVGNTYEIYQSNNSAGGTDLNVYVGTGGDVEVMMTAGVGTEKHLFQNVVSGSFLPIQVKRVLATNTTASNLLALR